MKECSADGGNASSWARYNDRRDVVNEYEYEGEITEPVASGLDGPRRQLASCLLNGATYDEQLRIAQYYHCPSTW